ncbi:MAG: site-2 protease family protein [Oscillospiraceae bacterium]|nr:site-2 protease family protein [Oscillospiraceae bacterium]
MNNDLLLQLLYAVPSALIAIVLHEFAHGWVSARLGDPTPGLTGRLSLNPLRHLDPLGTLALVVFHVGWAKPVQVNPRYYKKPKLGMVLTSLAGPCMNFLVAFVSYLCMGAVFRFAGAAFLLKDSVWYYVATFFNYCAMLNIGLGAFNLIPIPPLDGSKVLGAVLPEKWYFGYMKYERYGAIVMVALLWLGVLDPLLNAVQLFADNILWGGARFLMGL